ncbi:acetyl-CoA C-acetyltransferase [Actinomarinicola tropica]|uniref:Acetyl-CoA C-acyltransferase n=1 Tax=Actinomarinicola tropica TaxID=2789776 RepID=A0A5Q2RHA2_9ACTN|nr:acetyl-CoA C-acetyltransferase [Actinomarinicola tropica]QGG93696.1 acetyl-CoA C-acyltransferase [Actinomarinicola tropica]
MTEAWIIDACRTPRGVGKVGKGALADVHPQVLGAATLRALAERNDLDTSIVDDVIWGCSLQVGTQGGALGRMTALDAGWDTTTSGFTLDRYCGSGITAVNLAAGMVASGLEGVVVAGGAEMMSSYAENSSKVRHPFMDKGNPHLRELHPQSNQGVAADAIATLEGISRQALDELGAESQRRAAVAIEEGRFERSLVPVHHPDGTLALDREEYPRPGTTAEKLSQLAPSFEAVADIPLDEDGRTFRSEILRRYPDLEIEHVHHAGNSSGVVDGAGALLLANSEVATANGWTPRARVVAMANVGDDPTLMLNAPVPATRKVLEKAGMTLDDIDLFEVNEAFAVVVEKYIRDLGIDREKINVNGGAIALGHPIGATGSMLVGTLLDELERQDLERGLITMCAAGGMAPAIIIERI